jgi:lactoylglutathione lyase
MKKLSLILLAAAALAVTVLATRTWTLAEEKKAAKEFASTTIDLGVVVGDVDKSVGFYKEAIGFQEQKGFSVPGDFCADAGLTSGKALEIRVLALGDDKTATKLKLMTVPGAGTKKGDPEYVHSQYGYRYITLHITDMDAAMERLNKAGVKPLGKAPVPLPKGLPEGVFLTCVRDPDGNIVELVGPKAK